MSAPYRFDYLYAILAFLGFLLAHAKENAQRHEESYVDQLKHAGPSTICGYIVGLLATIPPTELIVEIPFAINIVTFLSKLSKSEQAAIEIFFYTMFAGKKFGWRFTTMLMAMGFVASPMLTTVDASRNYEIEFNTVLVIMFVPQFFSFFLAKLEIFYIDIYFSPSRFAIYCAYSVSSRCWRPIGSGMDNFLRWYCRRLGLENERMAEELRRRNESSKACAYHRFFQNHQDANRLPFRFLENLQHLVVPGSRINNGVCTYHLLQATRAGEDILRNGSPEHRVLKAVHNNARMTMEMLEAFEMEGLQRCLDSGEVDFVEGYARLTRPFWPVDEIQEALRKIGRNGERPNNATLHRLMERGLVDACLEFRGNLLYNNSTTAFRFEMPNSRGVFANLP